MTEKPNQWQSIYHDRIREAGYTIDLEQLAIIEEFSRIEQALLQTTLNKPEPQGGFFSRVFSASPTPKTWVKGLYLYGNVGRGKTFLMDLFCEHIPFPVKRLHFHHFMKSIHDDLKKIKDTANPLAIIAEQFAEQHRILCLDEFMVTDITDAMLLYVLLKALMDNGVVIITTTNIAPDDLYKDGLQRVRFLPAIELIKNHMVVHEMGEGQDFRRRCLTQRPRFFSPLNEATHVELTAIVSELSKGLHLVHDDIISINDRSIAFVAKSQEVIWFEFRDLCEGYRSQLDYIALAQQFPVIVVSGIPLLDEFKEDAAKRFLLLVDELYDKRIDLILSSAVPIEQIYSGKKIQFEFERLQSRLFEMQSSEYGQTHVSS